MPTTRLLMPIKYNKTNNHFTAFSLLFVVIGSFGMLFFLTIDIFKDGSTSFGIRQLAGLAVSTIITLIGLGKQLPKQRTLLILLLLLFYLVGVLFMGLRPESNHMNNYYDVLVFTGFSNIPDTIINILGFIPLSYLMMLYIWEAKGLNNVYIIAVCVIMFGFGISLFIEVLQSRIPGRNSTMEDLIANSIGTVCGVAYFLLESSFSNKTNRSVKVGSKL